MKWLGSGVLAATALALTFANVARADSLVFIKESNVWIANADGSNAHRVTRDGTRAYPYWSPSQADDGTIVAVRATRSTRPRIYRMRQNGQLRNRPFGTPAPGTGAINTKVSPNGAFVAYWFASRVCRFCVGVTNQALISYSDRFTAPYALGSPHMGAYPSWIGNDTLLLTSGSAEVWYYRRGMREAAMWFADYETGGGSPIPTLLDAEASRNGQRLAVVRGNNRESVALYTMNGPPPTKPSPFSRTCGFYSGGGPLFEPTWSGNGRLLAVQDSRGIWVLPVPSFTSCGRPRLVVPGGSEPDFGPAPVRIRSAARG